MKMPKNIARIQGAFIFAQFVILFVVASVFVFVISVNYIRKVTFSRISSLDKTAALIAEQIKTQDQGLSAGCRGIIFCLSSTRKTVRMFLSGIRPWMSTSSCGRATT